MFDKGPCSSLVLRHERIEAAQQCPLYVSRRNDLELAEIGFVNQSRFYVDPRGEHPALDQELFFSTSWAELEVHFEVFTSLS